MARAKSIDDRKWNVSDGTTAQAIVDEIREAPFIVREIHRREKKRYPVPPFITSKLQQDAARKFNFPVKKTMMLAQRLYEGVELGEEGSVGLITYMRTDSTRVAESALHEVRAFIQHNYGDPYLPHHPIYYKSKKTAQEAHEAIRPTSVERTPEVMKGYLDGDLWKLYSLIWNRFVASQMNPAVFDQTDVEIEAGRVEFRATGSVMKFDGFLALYQEAKVEDTKEEDKEEGILPELREGERLEVRGLLPTQHFTQPPPRYNEASLVKALEARGIGRPSTYATILSYHPGPRIRAQTGREVLPDGHRGSRRRAAGREFSGYLRLRVHRTDGRPPRPHRIRPRAMDRFHEGFLRPPGQEAGRGKKGDAGRQGRRDTHRRGLRQVRQQNGHQVGQVRTIPRLFRLPGMQEHARNPPGLQPRTRRRPGRGSTRVREVREAHGSEAGKVRRVHGLLGLS